MNGPFVLDLTSASRLMDMVHDRCGEAILTEIKDKTPQFNKEKSKYNTYAQSYWNTGVGRYPKSESFVPKSYLSSMDFEAAEGETMTPLGKLWTDMERKKASGDEIVELSTGLEQSEKVEELCTLIREHLDFELKFHIITMIPTSSKLAFERESTAKHQFDKYFSEVPRSYCKETVDPVFVTYHKFRVISKTFNTRMQEYLMTSKNGCDTLNIAGVFIRFYSPRNSSLEPEYNIDLFFKRFSYLICFINSKKQYLSKKLIHFEDESMYKDVEKVFECIKACWNELHQLKIDIETGSFALGGSLPYFKVNHYNDHLDDIDLEINIEESKNGDSKKESEQEVSEEESINIDAEPLLTTEIKEEDEETTETDLVDEINQQSTNNNYLVANFSRLVTSQFDKKDKILKKKPNRSEITIEVDTYEVGLNIVNENFEKMEPHEIGRTYFPDGIPRMNNEFLLTTYSSAISPIYSYEGYFCTLVRLSLKKLLPDLFSEWYEESYKLFKSISIINFQGYNGLNNLLLHILLESGKSIPKTVDESLVKGTCSGGQLEEITFVNFLFDNLTNILSNDRSYYPSVGKMDSIPKDPMSIKSYFHFEELKGYDKASKTLLRSCFANQVKKINLATYGDYVYSLGTDIGMLSVYFPNLKEINVVSKTRENVDTATQMNNVFNSTVSDIESMGGVMEKFYDKLYLLFEGKPQKVVDLSENRSDIPNDNNQDDPGLKNIFSPSVRPMFDREDEKRLIVRAFIVAQITKDTIDQVVKLTGQRLEYLTLINSLLCQSPGLSILDKKEIIDYCIKSAKLPFASIDTSSYEYTEEKRILEEYLIYHSNKSEESLIHPDSIIYDSGYNWCNILLYFGLNIFKNPHSLEEFIFSMMVGRGAKLNGYNYEQTLLIELYMAKLLYENGSLELLAQGLSQIPDFQNMENLEETLKMVETDSNCTEELSTNEKVRALQFFFRFFTRPKLHPYYEKQKVQLNADKLVAMLTANYDIVRTADSILTLASCLGLLQEVLRGTIYCQSSKSNDVYVADELIKSHTNFLDSTDETEFNRQAALVQMIYNGQISDNETVVANELDKYYVSVESPKIIKTNIFNLLCSSLVRSIPLLLSLVDAMTPEDLLFQDGNGYTCLTVLTSQRVIPSIDVINAILDKQPKLINIPTFRLMTPLHMCCMDPSNINLAKHLVTKYDADTNVISAYGLTPYETAAIFYLKTLFSSKSVLGGYLKSTHSGMSWLKPKTNLKKREILKLMMTNRK